MGFWDELEDVLTNPLDHPFEAAMFMAMTEEWEKEEKEDDLDYLYDDHHTRDFAKVKEERPLSLREKKIAQLQWVFEQRKKELEKNATLGPAEMEPVTRTESREPPARPSVRIEETEKKRSQFSNMPIAFLILIVMSVIVLYVVYQYQ